MPPAFLYGSSLGTGHKEDGERWVCGGGNRVGGEETELVPSRKGAKKTKGSIRGKGIK